MNLTGCAASLRMLSEEIDYLQNNKGLHKQYVRTLQAASTVCSTSMASATFDAIPQIEVTSMMLPYTNLNVLITWCHVFNECRSFFSIRLVASMFGGIGESTRN